jgi:DNA polymerase-3 subunit alpha
MEKAEQVAREYDDIMGRGNYFLEVQANGVPEQEKVNAGIIEISKKTGIPIIATNDCHYLERRDARAHEILMCVGMKTTVNDPKRMHHPTDAYYLRSPRRWTCCSRICPRRWRTPSASATCATSS